MIDFAPLEGIRSIIWFVDLIPRNNVIGVVQDVVKVKSIPRLIKCWRSLVQWEHSRNITTTCKYSNTLTVTTLSMIALQKQPGNVPVSLCTVHTLFKLYVICVCIREEITQRNIWNSVSNMSERRHRVVVLDLKLSSLKIAFNTSESLAVTGTCYSLWNQED